MDLKELTFGVGSILRDNVNGWATADSGTPHVYPDHPPLSLSRGSYPRGTVDVIANITSDQDIEQDVEIGEATVDVTVYGINSSDVVSLLGDSHEAIIEHHDGTDSSGDPYLETWGYERTGTVSPIITDEAEEGFTRYNKTIEFEFAHVTAVV